MSEGDQEAATELILSELSSTCVDETPEHTDIDGWEASYHYIDLTKPYSETI